jgi:hypothetical protein
MYAGLLAFGALVALVFFAVWIVIEVLFLLNLQRLLEAVQPQNREMSAGLVWLNLIPVFNLGWMIYTVIKIKDSVGRENANLRGLINEGNTHTVGLVYSILTAASFVFSFAGRYSARGVSGFAGLISIAVLVTWIMYWVKTNRLKNELQQAGRRGYGQPGPYGGQYGAGAPPYGQGGQPYGQGGQPYGQPYGQPNQPYGQGGPGYGPGSGAGYGPDYGPGQGAAPAWQPPVPQAGQPQGGAPQPDASAPGTPPAGRSCALCGNRLAPDDQFCTACGTPAPKE